MKRFAPLFFVLAAMLVAGFYINSDAGYTIRMKSTSPTFEDGADAVANFNVACSDASATLVSSSKERRSIFLQNERASTFDIALGTSPNLSFTSIRGAELAPGVGYSSNDDDVIFCRASGGGTQNLIGEEAVQAGD